MQTMLGPPLAQRSDEQLIADYLRDRESAAGHAAVRELIDRWSGPVYRWALRIVRERELALDLAQDSIIKAYEALPRYEARGTFSAWLFVIVHRRCISAVRRRSLTVDPEISPDGLVSGDPGVEEAFESSETVRRVLLVMQQVLDPRERAALWMRAYEGMSVDDITELLGVDGDSGARGLLQTARRKLRAALEAPRSDARGSHHGRTVES